MAFTLWPLVTTPPLVQRLLPAAGNAVPAQPAPGDPGVTARMELGPATQTFVLELRCLEDGGPGPDTLSGITLQVTSNYMVNRMLLWKLLSQEVRVTT